MANVLLPGMLYSQRDASSFVPTDIAGLVAWYRADVGTQQQNNCTVPAVNDGAAVGCWQDQSGNGHHATQALAGAKPQLKLNIQNGQPVIRFDGATDFFSNAFQFFEWSAGKYLLFCCHSQDSRG